MNVTKLAIMVSVASAMAAFGVGGTASATTVSNNHGAIVKVSGSCSKIASAITNNHGAIVKITGDGTCDVNQVIKSGAISENHGAIIKIDGVCGTAPTEVKNNHGTIVKISSNGACKAASVEVKDNHGTIVKVDKKETKQQETPAPQEVKGTTTEEQQIPETLPNTGAGSMLGLAAAATIVSTVAATFAHRMFLKTRA